MKFEAKPIPSRKSESARLYVEFDVRRNWLLQEVYRIMKKDESGIKYSIVNLLHVLQALELDYLINGEKER